MNRYKKLFSDTVILGLGTFGSKLLVFLLMPFYTAWLSTDQYSTAELITSTANLLIPLACVGIANGIFRFELVGELDADANELADDVKKYLEGKCAFADVKDRTRRRIDVSVYANDLSLAGEFVRGVFAAKGYTDEEKEQIASLGLRALKGIEVDR